MEITDINRFFMDTGRAKGVVFDCHWADCGTIEALLETSVLVEIGIKTLAKENEDKIRALLTGGGFIGSHTIRLAIESKEIERVVNLDSLTYSVNL